MGAFGKVPMRSKLVAGATTSEFIVDSGWDVKFANAPWEAESPQNITKIIARFKGDLVNKYLVIGILYHKTSIFRKTLERL
jgi:hypothetical protein